MFRDGDPQPSKGRGRRKQGGEDREKQRGQETDSIKGQLSEGKTNEPKENIHWNLRLFYFGKGRV